MQHQLQERRFRRLLPEGVLVAAYHFKYERNVIQTRKNPEAGE
jgi:hypothetical protein